MAKPTPWGRSVGSDAEAEGTASPAAGTASPTHAGASTGATAAEPDRDQERTARWEAHRATVGTLLREARGRAEGIRTAPQLIGKWGYIFSALAAVVAFILMFQYWLVAKGPDGVVKVNAFGRIDQSSRYLQVWSSKGAPPAADLTGSWAVVTSIAIATTLAAIVIYIITNSPRFARIATGASVTSAVLVTVNLLYLTSQQKALKNMTVRRWDLGGQIGSWVDWAFNDGTKPIAGLNQLEYVASGIVTAPAIAAVITAAVGAVIAVATMPRRAPGAPRFPWRITVSRASSANYLAASEPTPTPEGRRTEAEQPTQPAPEPPDEPQRPAPAPGDPDR